PSVPPTSPTPTASRSKPRGGCTTPPPNPATTTTSDASPTPNPSPHSKNSKQPEQSPHNPATPRQRACEQRTRSETHHHARHHDQDRDRRLRSVENTALPPRRQPSPVRNNRRTRLPGHRQPRRRAVPHQDRRHGPRDAMVQNRHLQRRHTVGQSHRPRLLPRATTNLTQASPTGTTGEP